MIIRKIIILISLFGWTITCVGQDQKRNALELNVDLGISYDFGAPEIYMTWAFFEDLVAENRSPARTRNWSVCYTRFINPKNGIKISFGQTQFGFDYGGKLQNSETPIIGFHRLTNLEFGVSYLRKISISEHALILIEPGLRYHSDGSSESNAINISTLDVFSFSGYTGIEFPMMGDHFFTNVGLQVKLPLQRYNFDFGSNPPYYPYFIGVKIGVSFQF